MRVRAILLLPLLVAACQTVPPVAREELEASLRSHASEADLRALVDDRDLGFEVSYRTLRELERKGAPPAFLDWLVQREIERDAWLRASRAWPPYGWYPYHPYAGWWWHRPYRGW